MSLELRFHPAARRPVLATAVALGLGVLGGAAWALVPEPAVVLPLAALLLASLLPFYAPTEYRLDPEGVEVRRLGHRERHPWSRFRSFRREGNGLLLRGDGEPPREPAGLGARLLHSRARSRSVFLPMDAELGARAGEFLEGRLPRS